MTIVVIAPSLRDARAQAEWEHPEYRVTECHVLDSTFSPTHQFLVVLDKEEVDGKR